MALMLNVRVTGGAELKVASPGCCATSAHCPGLCSVTVVALTPGKFRLVAEGVQMPGVFVPNVTVKPEEAVAVIPNGGPGMVWVGMGGKSMV